MFTRFKKEQIEDKIYKDIINWYIKRNKYWFWTDKIIQKYYTIDPVKENYIYRSLSRKLRIAKKMKEENYIKKTSEILEEFYNNILIRIPH